MSMQTAVPAPCLPKKNSGFAKRNSAAALEWAKQKNARILRAKEIRADRSLAQKRRELKELGVPGSPKKTPDSADIDSKDARGDVCSGNDDPVDPQPAPISGERKIFSGRRASIPENLAAAPKQEPHHGGEKTGIGRLRDSLQIVDEAPECSTLKEGEGQGALDRVVRHGRRRTIPSSLENEFDEDSENRDRCAEALAAVRTKVMNSKALARDTAWPAWAMADDPIQKVRNKLQSKFSWLTSGRQPKPHIAESENGAHHALRDKANHCPMTNPRESCIPRIDENRQTPPVDAVVFLQTNKELPVVHPTGGGCTTPVGVDSASDKNALHRQRSARLEYLKRRSSARRLRKCISEQRGQAARVESPDDPFKSRSQDVCTAAVNESNSRGSISLLRPPPEVRNLSPRVASQPAADATVRASDIVSGRNRKLSALKRQIVKSEACVPSIDLRARDHDNADSSSWGASRTTGEEVISEVPCHARSGRNPVSPPGPSLARTRRVRRQKDDHPPGNSSPSPLTVDGKRGWSAVDVGVDFPAEAFDRSSSGSKMECPSCGRKFVAAASFSKHERVCVRVFKRKRKVFNSSAARLLGTAAEQYNVPQKPRRGRATAAAQVERMKPTQWRQKSADLRDTMMCMRGG